MAESTPPSRTRLDDGENPRPIATESASSGSRRPLRLIDHAMRAPAPSHPPSEPRPVPGRPGADASPDKPARVQLIAALLLLLVLVVVPLYLWRRPRAAVTEDTNPNASAALVAATFAEPLSTVEPKVHTKDGVTVSDAKVIGCHDRGSRRTTSAACDRVPALENAFAKAILDASACVPPGSPAGAIAFVLDASYARHKSPVHVNHSREGTTMPAKLVAACVTDVKNALANTPFDQTHAHTRYEIEVSATYAGKR